MKTEIKKLPKSELLITVELSAEELDAYEIAAAKRISESVEVPGFRKGQAPKAFVIAKVGPDAFFQEVLGVALPRSYFDVIKKDDLKVISRPDIKVLSKSPLKYEARVAVLPEIKVNGVDKMKIPQKEVKVDEKEVNEIIEDMRKYRAEYKPLTREVKKGDRIEIDFQGYDEGGAALDSAKSKNHPLFVGEGTLIPGFEENLVGMKIGDKKKFPLKFPKDFHHEPFRNKNVHFEVEIKKGDEPILPELTPEFVEKIMGEKKTIAEFKEALKTDIAAKKKVESKHERENELLEEFLKNSELDVPPVLVEEEVEYMLDDLKHELEHRGINPETYLEKLAKEKKDLKKEYEPEAEKRVKIRLVLNYLFRTLEIKVGDDEMKSAIARLVANSKPEEKASIDKDIAAKGQLYARLQNNLMVEKLFARFLE
ncbi:MAG: trigger factor [Candidatus Gracilibacteria bacterium]